MRISDWSSDVLFRSAYLQTRAGTYLYLYLTYRQATFSCKSGSACFQQRLKVRSLNIRSPTQHVPRQRPPLTQQLIKCRFELGRASGRERVCQYVQMLVVGVSCKKKKRCNSNKK